MIHNIVVVDGQEYKAVEDKGLCRGCAFDKSEACNIELKCSINERGNIDGKSAVYKPHYKLKHK